MDPVRELGEIAEGWPFHHTQAVAVRAWLARYGPFIEAAMRVALMRDALTQTPGGTTDLWRFQDGMDAAYRAALEKGEPK